MSKEIAQHIASGLLQIKAIKLNITNPFTWASGWKSPIYCDNRISLSHPELRDYIKESFAKLIIENYPEVQKIAGVATAGIAHGALVADLMKLPFVYVRGKAKEHGMGNLIEGEIHEGEKIVLIEDLISTGGSSLSSVEALRGAGCEVLGMGAIFTYGFQKSVDAFAKSQCSLFTLTDYPVLIEIAVEKKYVQSNELESLKQWREAPEKWGV